MHKIRDQTISFKEKRTFMFLDMSRFNVIYKHHHLQ